MSITLRQESQPILDNFDLHNFHCDITSARHLCIVASCGKPLANVSGIKFSKLSPSISEITYACTLLNDFLTTHIDELKNVLNCTSSLNKALKALESIPAVRGLVVNETKISYRSFEFTGYTVKYETDTEKLHIRYNKSLAIENIGINSTFSKFSAANKSDVLTDKTLFKTFDKIIKANYKVKLCLDKLDAANAVVNSCSI